MKKLSFFKLPFINQIHRFDWLDSSFCWMSPPSSIGLGVLICFFFLACQPNRSPSENTSSNTNNGTIDQFLASLDNFKQQSESIYGDFGQPLGQHIQNIEKQQNLYSKSTEELRTELLSEVKETDREDFYTELQTIWNVGKHQAFFKRQISYCQLKIDLAVVGMGIIRVDEVLKGDNSSVQQKDTSAFIKYVREQIQQAIASKDKNYKAIVFKGLESSST